MAAGGSGHGGRFGAAGVGAEAGAGPGVGGGEEDEHAALGLGQAELEEARMMEAAMLGIPYEPRLPPRCALPMSSCCIVAGFVLFIVWLLLCCVLFVVGRHAACKLLSERMQVLVLWGVGCWPDKPQRQQLR